ncbi:fibronectin type III domain-containing protein [Polyangium aurulentum]|uniref:fibronectin type III domain-containing protein n=1 Tax=Polyangium aurulentum TaxID=2567896 RepID=UPI0010ADA7E6|nr:fibronectin type III domain-containing protein [Polyangium aurulentum]UQA54896.1 fibronectin type III domain-containing protein [Polyangium aurulentum]
MPDAFSEEGLFVFGQIGASTDLDCASAIALGDLVTCIRSHMPRSGSEGFVVPTTAERLDFRGVVRKMLNGHCDFALPQSLAGAMRLRSFDDAENGKTYCVLMEVADANADGYVDRGWGTFIVDPTASRELVHEAPHPLADAETDLEAVEIFKGTDSRGYLLCGAHRAANAAASGCDASYKEADCAHAVANMFHPAVLEIDAFYGARPHTQIQWHGMAPTTCASLGAHASQGVSKAPLAGTNVLALQKNASLHNPTWVVGVPGGAACDLDATDNVAGRFLNGVPLASTCSTEAGSATGEFLHVEQHMALRAASGWIAPVAETFPIAFPTPPASLTATSGPAFVALSWTASNGASGYDVLRASTSGGPYAAVATSVVTTSYFDKSVKKGGTYHYVVRARNPLGVSAPSNGVTVKPK